MLVYGRNVAKEYLKSDKKIKNITLLNGFNDKEIISLIEKRNIKTEYKDKREFMPFDKYSHQGIILDVEDFSYSTLDEITSDPNSKIIILDHIEDPHNFGAIIRTVEASGISGIIIPKDRSVSVNGTTIKTSAGAINYVKIVEVTNIVNTIKELKEKGFWIVGTDMDGEDYRTLDYSGKIAAIIGNEGKGIGNNVKNNCDFIARIPMNGKINSLNASVAAAIIIYEMIK